MNNYRKSCAICETGEALCELFHRETSLTKKSGIAFSSHIARAFADACFLEANTKKQLGKLDNKYAAITLNPIKDNQLDANIFSVIYNPIFDSWKKVNAHEALNTGQLSILSIKIFCVMLRLFRKFNNFSHITNFYNFIISIKTKHRV